MSASVISFGSPTSHNLASQVTIERKYIAAPSSLYFAERPPKKPDVTPSQT
jgi:hypothetical protein